MKTYQEFLEQSDISKQIAKDNQKFRNAVSGLSKMIDGMVKANQKKLQDPKFKKNAQLMAQERGIEATLSGIKIELDRIFRQF